MAARLRKTHQDEIRAYRFYVYEVHGPSGELLYVGKGSGRRMFVSAKKHGGSACDVAWFNAEKDAYAYEVLRIAQCCPLNNAHPGGNGAKAITRRVQPRKTALEKLVDQIGSRAVAARLWLAYADGRGGDMSKLEQIRQVAYG